MVIHVDIGTPQNTPKEGQNYCRTPLTDQGSPGGPWFYSSDGGWDSCNVPVCGVNQM